MTKKVLLIGHVNHGTTLTPEMLTDAFKQLEDVPMEPHKPVRVVDDRPAPFFPEDKVFKLKMLRSANNLEPVPQYIRPEPKTHRNSPCHCGSSKKI